MRRLISVVLGVVFALTLSPVGRAHAATVVTFPDAQLESAVRSELSKPVGPITDGDMLTLTSLYGYGLGIVDLTGLEYASNLETLNLGSNDITTITPVASLTKLTSLYLDSNAITTITPVAGLTGLTSLGLSQNQIVDVSAVSGLSSLEYLNLGENLVADISPITGLGSLTQLSLSYNQIADIGPVSGLTNLSYLDLGYNQYSDVSPVADLTALDILFIDGNSLTTVGPLSKLTNLTELYAGSNLISDVTPVKDMTQLSVLDLGDNQIANVSPLAGLTNLNRLYLPYNHVSDIASLVGLASLQDLVITQNYLDLTPGSAAMTAIATMTSNGVYVDYDPQFTYTITPAGTLHGTISPGDQQFVAHGASKTFNVTAAAGYHLVDVRKDDVSIGPSSTVTFVNVTADHTISATFEPNPGSVSGVVSTGGLGLSGVSVTVAGKSATTDNAGAYSISDVATGTYTATFARTSYVTKSVGGVVVTAGPSTTVNAALSLTPFNPTVVGNPAGGKSYKRKKGVAKYTLAARVVGPVGAVSGATVYLQSRSSTKRDWKNSFTRVTDAAGNVSVAFKSKKKSTTYYRWVIVAQSPVNAATGPSQKIVVK